MKNFSVKIAVFAIVAFGMALSSCNSTIEVTKRQHRKGYHVSVSKKKSEAYLAKYQEEKVTFEAAKTVAINDALAEIITTKSLKTGAEGQSIKKTTANDSKHLTSSNIEKTSLLKTVKAVRKAKKEFKQLKKTTVSNTSFDEDWDISSDMMFVLMLILAVLLPPAAVFLIKGKSNTFNLRFKYCSLRITL